MNVCRKFSTFSPPLCNLKNSVHENVQKKRKFTDMIGRLPGCFVHDQRLESRWPEPTREHSSGSTDGYRFTAYSTSNRNTLEAKTQRIDLPRWRRRKQETDTTTTGRHVTPHDAWHRRHPSSSTRSGALLPNGHEPIKIKLRAFYFPDVRQTGPLHRDVHSAVGPEASTTRLDEKKKGYYRVTEL